MHAAISPPIPQFTLGHPHRATYTACQSAITIGLLSSWSSPFIVKLTSDKENYDISEDEAFLFTIIPPLAMIISCPFFSKSCDIIGRKHTLMLLSIPHILSWLVTTLSSSIYVFYLSRFFAGVGHGCFFVSLPLYIGEISTPRVRGIWGNLLNVLNYAGIFLINLIGSKYSVNVTAYLCLPLPIVYMVSVYFLPESPYWYIMKNRYDDAKNSLRKLRQVDNVEELFLQLQEEIVKRKDERSTWKDLLVKHLNRRALRAGIFLRISQLLGGVTVFNVYMQFIFKHSGSNVNPEVPALIYSGLCCILIFVAGFIIENVGKRRAFMVSIFLCGVVLLSEAAYFYVSENVKSIDLSNYRWYPLAGMLMYVVFCCNGIILIPSLMLSELFAPNFKSKGLSVLVIVFGLMIFISNFLFYILESRLGMYGPFLVFGINNMIATAVTPYVVPETSGKTLEEIQLSLERTRPIWNTFKYKLEITTV
ncbi:unnamed protein product [Psylliodes chrysocephalus]|uniref:Major facilitator superfamily (MFS) profile domain-containing protein n=1 Tax=Psylliodes chrysocephalus TaxID=3402493 RepID=A0A9P0D5A3_9CUCU|nr:unnamed protein product [Psylliodes chrysocephala]